MRNRVRMSIFTASLVLAFSGCASNGESKKQEYAAQGCLAGAVGGAGIGALLSDKDKTKKAALGAAAGCAAGAVVGYQIGARTDEYADAQEAVTSEIARNDQNLSEVREYNAQLVQNIGEYERHISEVKQSTQSAEEQQASLTEARQLVTDQRDQAYAAYNSVNEEFKTSVEQYSKYKSSTATEESESWRLKLVALQQERNILGEHVNSLNSLSASI